MKWFLGACVSNLLRGLESYEYHAICIPPALAAREWECALTCVCVFLREQSRGVRITCVTD